VAKYMQFDESDKLEDILFNIYHLRQFWRVHASLQADLEEIIRTAWQEIGDKIKEYKETDTYKNILEETNAKV
jgi:hypothetical protein